MLYVLPAAEVLTSIHATPCSDHHSQLHLMRMQQLPGPDAVSTWYAAAVDVCGQTYSVGLVELSC